MLMATPAPAASAPSPAPEPEPTAPAPAPAPAPPAPAVQEKEAPVEVAAAVEPQPQPSITVEDDKESAIGQKLKAIFRAVAGHTQFNSYFEESELDYRLNKDTLLKMLADAGAVAAFAKHGDGKVAYDEMVSDVDGDQQGNVSMQEFMETFNAALKTPGPSASPPSAAVAAPAPVPAQAAPVSAAAAAPMPTITSHRPGKKKTGKGPTAPAGFGKGSKPLATLGRVRVQRPPSPEAVRKPGVAWGSDMLKSAPPPPEPSRSSGDGDGATTSMSNLDDDLANNPLFKIVPQAKHMSEKSPSKNMERKTSGALAESYINRVENWPRDMADDKRRVYEALRSLYTENEGATLQSLQLSRTDLNYPLTEGDLSAILEGIGVFDPTNPSGVNLHEAFTLAGPNPATNTVSFAQFISICDPEQIKQAQSRIFDRMSTIASTHDGDESSDNEEMPLLHEHHTLKRKIAALLAAADDVDGTTSGGVMQEDVISDEEMVAVYSVQGPNGLLKLAAELNLMNRIHGEDGQDDRSAEAILMSLDLSGHGQITLMQLLSTISHTQDVSLPGVGNGSMPPLGTPADPSGGGRMGQRRHSVLQLAIHGHLTTDDMMAMAQDQREADQAVAAELEPAPEPEVTMRPKKDNATHNSPLKRRSSVTDRDGMALAQLQRQGSLKEASDVRQTQERRTTLSQMQFQRHSAELKHRQLEVMHAANEQQLAANNAARVAKNRREARSRWSEVLLPMPWDV